MARFTYTGTPPKELTELKIVPKSKRLIRLEGVKALIATDIKVSSSNSNIAKATIRQRPFDGGKGIWNIDIETFSDSTGTVDIQATFNGATVSTIKIQLIVEDKIQLPIAMTKEGILARLFLLESLSPNFHGYNIVQVKKAMLWMRLVIENRMSHKTPRIFYAKKGKNSMWDTFDIVMPRSQFHGFEKYPALSVDMEKRTENILDTENDYSDTRQTKYAEFVKAAISSAKAAKPTEDPCKTRLYGWRTQGSRHPGGQFVKYKDYAGQTFYTLG